MIGPGSSSMWRSHSVLLICLLLCSPLSSPLLSSFLNSPPKKTPILFLRRASNSPTNGVVTYRLSNKTIYRGTNTIRPGSSSMWLSHSVLLICLSLCSPLSSPLLSSFPNSPPHSRSLPLSRGGILKTFSSFFLTFFLNLWVRNALKIFPKTNSENLNAIFSRLDHLLPIFDHAPFGPLTNRTNCCKGMSTNSSVP